MNEDKRELDAAHNGTGPNDQRPSTEDVWNELEPELRRLTSRCPPELGEEIYSLVALAFAKGFPEWQSQHPSGPAIAWIRTVFKSKRIDLQRRGNISRKRSAAVSVDDLPLADESRPDVDFERRAACEEANKVRPALLVLAAKRLSWARAVYLSFIEEHDIDHVAQNAGVRPVSKRQAQRWLVDGLKALRDILDADTAITSTQRELEHDNQ